MPIIKKSALFTVGIFVAYLFFNVWLLLGGFDLGERTVMTMPGSRDMHANGYYTYKSTTGDSILLSNALKTTRYRYCFIETTELMDLFAIDEVVNKRLQQSNDTIAFYKAGSIELKSNAVMPAVPFLPDSISLSSAVFHPVFKIQNAGSSNRYHHKLTWGPIAELFL